MVIDALRILRASNRFRYDWDGLVTLRALMGYSQDIRHGDAWWNGETKA